MIHGQSAKVLFDSWAKIGRRRTSIKVFSVSFNIFQDQKIACKHSVVLFLLAFLVFFYEETSLKKLNEFSGKCIGFVTNLIVLISLEKKNRKTRRSNFFYFFTIRNTTLQQGL